MHTALLIDEILQVILGHCEEWTGTQYRDTLAKLARCCKAWKEPALDRLWKRVDNPEALQKLNDMFEGCKVRDIPLFRRCEHVSPSVMQSPEDFSFLLSHSLLYASRVRHLTLNAPPAYPAMTRDLTPFPNLKSLVLKGEGYSIDSILLRTTSLQELDIDLRSPRSRKPTEDRSLQLATTLEDAPSLRDSLQTLRLKGFMHTALNRLIPSFQNLRSLVLLAGHSLSSDTLAALGSIAYLENLYVHASHIDSGDFTAAVTRRSVQPFSSLRSLRVRASRSLFCAIFDMLPRGTLRSLYLETEEAAQGPSAWHPTFALIASKTADTLIELTLDQILDPDELEATLSSAPADTRFALNTLQPLSKLRVLRRLTIDAMLLPDFSDRDIDQMAAWWPRLERLDLGFLPDVQDHGEDIVPKLTVNVLQHLAMRCPSLHTLTIPLDITTCKATNSKSVSGDEQTTRPLVAQKALEKLFVGPPPADEDVNVFVRSVLDIFPCMQEIEFTSAERSLWLDVQKGFKDCAREVEGRKGTSDGCADGQ